MVVAPATAHWLAAMANGLAGDVVTAAALATSAPMVVAPAMDGDMWTHPATVTNVARLRDGFGYTVVCAGVRSARVGPVRASGRLADLPLDRRRGGRRRSPGARPPADATDAAAARADGPPREADLVGRRIVITAGGTREPIDPVRYIGNRSTGRMGVALADAALARGAR